MTAVLPDRSVAAHHPVSGHDDRDRGAGTGRSDGAVSARRTGGDRDLAVGRDLAVRHLADGAESFACEPGGGEQPVDGRLELAQPPREVRVELAGDRGGGPGVVNGRCAEGEREIGDGDVDGAFEDVEVDQARLGHDEEGIAHGRGMHGECCVGHGSIIPGAHAGARLSTASGERPSRPGPGEEPPIVRRVGNSAKLGGA